MGFVCTLRRLRAIPCVDNLYVVGPDGPNLCFAGHTDVVPEGVASQWMPCFGGEIHDGNYGRGAADMRRYCCHFGIRQRHIASRPFVFNNRR